MIDYALRYPIGKSDFTEPVKPEDRADRIAAIRELPLELTLSLRGLNDSQLNTPYRDGGWTVKQVVHHLCDAGVVLYLRTKQVLMEDCPKVTPFDDHKMLAMADGESSTETALKLIEGLHTRWAIVLESLSAEQFHRKYVHFERGEESLDKLLAYAAWHSRHHTAHITALRARMNW